VVDYSPPAEQVLPFENLPSEDTPLTAEWLNHLDALLADIATATTGRIPVLEAVSSTEAIRDTIGTTLVAGSGITVTVDDPGNTVTITNTGSAYTNEDARDAIGTALVAGSGMTVTVSDVGDTITLATTGSGGFTPADHGFITWSYDPSLASSSTAMGTTGILHLVKVKLAAAATVTGVGLYISTVGSSVSGGYVALYDSTGTRVAVSSAITTAWQATGYVQNAFTGTYSAAAGTYYAAILQASGTAPTFSRSSTSLAVNAGLSAGSLRYSTYSSGLVVTPSSVTLASQAAPVAGWWVSLY
jgi:hypothetical protein